MIEIIISFVSIVVLMVCGAYAATCWITGRHKGDLWMAVTCFALAIIAYIITLIDSMNL